MFKLLLHISRLAYILALTLALVSCNMPGLSEAQVAAELPAPPAGAWIDAPLSGAEAPPGTSIKVIGHVDPSVGQAMLYINGANSGLPSAPILNKKPPAYEWEWTPEQPGVYNLRVGGAGGPLSSIVRVTITGEISYRAKFWADQTSLKLGECTALHWETENALHVQLQGAEVEPQGNLGVCPQQDETQVLRVEYKDKHSEELTVNITVLVDTITPTITSTPTPTLTLTPTMTFTPTTVPAVPAELSFTPQVSTNQFYYGGCSPDQVTIQVQVSAGNVTSVVLFKQLEDQATGSKTGWDQGKAMTPSGGGWFSRTVTAKSVDGADSVSSAWLLYQFAATGSTGQVVGRSQVYRNVTLSACGAPQPPPARIITISPTTGFIIVPILPPIFIIPSVTPTFPVIK